MPAEPPRTPPSAPPLWAEFPSRQKPARKRLLLPRSTLHPLVVLAICAVPQIILLAINFSAWQLGASEMSPSERFAAWQIFAAQLLALVSGAGLSIWLYGRKEILQRWQGLIPLVSSLGFLAAVFVLGDNAIPAAVADWMLPQDQWMLKQFALAMPAALYGALRLLCPDSDDDQAVFLFDRSIATAVVLFALCIGSFFFIIHAMNSVPFPMREAIPLFSFQIFLIFTFMLLSTLAAASLLRASISAYAWARNSHPGALAAFTVWIALAGPILGLLLNSGIPFPADFQSTSIYIAATINGLVLLLPNFSHPLARRLVWIAQCVMFPFTAYFFAVFLPFILLAPFGLMVVGLGILIYVPSLLFLLHGHRLIDGYHSQVQGGSKWATAAIGVGAILIWPIAYTAQAQWDRASLHKALDYLQYPNYAKNSRFEGSLFALRSSLENLRDFKEGLYLPFVSEYYNWLAFDGMVLPQSKLNDLGETFFGEPLGKSVRRPTFNGIGLGARGARNMTEAVNGVQGERPSADARLETVQTSVRHGDGVIRGLVRLTVFNPTGQPTEYRTSLQIPPGVLISGLWLTIGKERVPGRIFEKRAAMWVYQKITEVRPVPCDPAILRYTGPGSAELSVYPVDGHNTRVVEVEFLYAEGTKPSIELDGHGTLSLPTKELPEASVGVSEGGELMVTIPASQSLPQVNREPCFHFLVDTSEASAYANPENIRKSLEALARQFPAISQARLTFVNFETRDALGGKMVPLKELLKAPAAELTSPVRGGLLASRAIKEVLWKQQTSLDAGEPAALQYYPQIVVLRGSDRAKRPEEAARLEEFARLAPDLPGYWTFEASVGAMPSVFVPFVRTDKKTERSPVHILQVGGTRFAAPAGRQAAWVSLAPAKSAVEQIEAFSPKEGKFVFVGKVAKPADPAYGRAVAPWSLEMRRLFEPWRQKKEALGELLALCRATGILVPSVSYMVVENTAQWQMLERAEKKATKGHEGLAMQESVPEPSTILLVITGAAALLCSRRRSGRG